MALINTMYQYSLTSYLDVFEFSLRKSIPDANLERRLKNIMNTLTLNVYNYGCTGIFEKHKLLYSFVITIKLEQDRGNLTQDELDFFIKGNLSLEKSKRKKPFPWVNDATWEDCVRLARDFTQFTNLLDDIEHNENMWKKVRFVYQRFLEFYFEYFSSGSIVIHRNRKIIFRWTMVNVHRHFKT